VLHNETISSRSGNWLKSVVPVTVDYADMACPCKRTVVCRRSCCLHFQVHSFKVSSRYKLVWA